MYEWLPLLRVESRSLQGFACIGKQGIEVELDERSATTHTMDDMRSSWNTLGSPRAEWQSRFEEQYGLWQLPGGWISPWGYIRDMPLGSWSGTRDVSYASTRKRRTSFAKHNDTPLACNIAFHEILRHTYRLASASSQSTQHKRT